MEKIQMISVKEISEVLGIGLNQAYDLVKRDDFPSFKVGQKYLVPANKFMDWLDAQCRKK